MAWWDDFGGDWNSDFGTSSGEDYAPSYSSESYIDAGGMGGVGDYGSDIYSDPMSGYGYESPSYGYDSAPYAIAQQYTDTPSPSETWIDSGGMGSGSYQTYANNSAAQPGLWDTINSYGRQLESPGGKMVVGGLGALVSAYGADKQNKLNKKASKKQQEMLAARMARNQAHDAPLNFVQARQRVAPVATRGESSWYDQNALSANKPTSDKGIFAAAEGGQPPPNEDNPSVMGWLRYIANSKKFPSDLRQEGEEKAYRTGVPNKYVTRQQILNQQHAEAEGGESPIQRARGGLANYVRGGTSGQADKIPAQLSDGEYIMDADTVASLGDGNNAAGAAKLDKMRQNIRAHKRAAPTSKIPPKAKAPQAYLKGK